MLKLRTLFLAAFAAITLGIGSSPVFAITFFSPITGFEDDDIEFYIPLAGSATNTTATTGNLSLGDRLVGAAEFNLTHSVLPPGSSVPISPQELTAVFDLTVTGKVCQAPGVNCLFTFSPTNTTGTQGVLAGLPGGTAVALWLDNVNDIDLVAVNCTSLANCVDLANNGNLFLTGGSFGDPDYAWSAFAATDNINTVFLAAATSHPGTYNICLQVGINNTGQTPLVEQPCILGGATQIVGGGTINGGQGLTNGAFARSDNDFQIRVAVPEPSTLLLLGVGLLGVSFISRRSTKKK